MNIEVSHADYLSTATTRLVGLLPREGTMPDWFTESVDVQRYARAGDGRIYALLVIDCTRSWADVVTGTLFRATDGRSWSSLRCLDLESLTEVTRDVVAKWSLDAFARGSRRH